MPPRRVAVVAFEGANALDIAGPVEVFDVASQLLATMDRPGYDLGIATTGAAAITSSSGIGMAARWSLDPDDLSPAEAPLDTLLVAGGAGSRPASDDDAFVAEVRTAAACARRVGSVCTGAFVLAATGLLDGRPATTHWAWADALARKHPAVEVRPDAIYTCDRGVWTSAGVTAGIDLALALVADDHDDEVARQVAQYLVVYLRRAGGQSQFSAPVSAATARRDEIRAVQEWVAADPARDCSVDALAAVASMSPRHFARLFREQVGVTPARWVESCRLDLARSLLETTDLTVAQVASAVGTGDASTLHRLFDRHLATTPAAYRTHHSNRPRNPR